MTNDILETIDGLGENLNIEKLKKKNKNIVHTEIYIFHIIIC